jgi:hypothetical protein
MFIVPLMITILSLGVFDGQGGLGTGSSSPGNVSSVGKVDVMITDHPLFSNLSLPDVDFIVSGTTVGGRSYTIGAAYPFGITHNERHDNLVFEVFPSEDMDPQDVGSYITPGNDGIPVMYGPDWVEFNIRTEVDGFSGLVGQSAFANASCSSVSSSGSCYGMDGMIFNDKHSAKKKVTRSYKTITIPSGNGDMSIKWPQYIVGNVDIEATVCPGGN